MRRYYTFIFFILFQVMLLHAQQDYAKQWKKVENFELEGKTRSASKAVEKIFRKAIRKDNSPQIVKSFIYKSKFALILSEESQTNILSELDHIIARETSPAAAILESLYAGFLEQYLNKNQYQIRRRTKTDTTYTVWDFKKWDITTLTAEIARHYNNSVKELDKLKEIPVEAFEAILTESKTSEKYRPALLDLLAQRAIDFYKDDKYYVTRPKERFYINDPLVFAATEDFIKEDFNTPDSLFSKRNVLKLYQKLEAFHQNNNATAYVDVVLARLRFTRSKAILPGKEQLYLKALQELSDRFKGKEVSAIINYYIADYHFGKSNNPNAKHHPAFKNARIKAHEICASVTAQFPNSDGGLLCKILKNKIEKLHLEITTEKYILPDKPFLAKVDFKSVDSVYITIHKIPFSFFEGYYAAQDSLVMAYSNTNKPYQTRFYKLQPKKDYYKYTTELAIPGLPVGHYLLVASDRAENFNRKSVFGYATFTATRLTLLNINKDDKNTVKIVHRNSGKPIKGVQLQFLDEDDKSYKTGKTNVYGEFALKKDPKKWHRLTAIASFEKDSIINNYSLNRYYNYNNNDDDNERVARSFLYLDRSIYRPGQTLYFKGILTEKKNGKSSVVPHVYTTVIIYDANDQEIKEFRLKTNEYGTISGSFKLPKNVLTGEFYIEMDEDLNPDGKDDPYWEKINDFDYNETYFSVEEYKRPRFEVTFDKVTENYKLGDSVTVTGHAKALLGSTITDAKVIYTVTRKSDLIDWRYYNTRPKDQVLKTGELKTDAQGRFAIDFMAVPDSSAVKENATVFRYEIAADVTDINGETRSTETTVKIGYKNLVADVLISSRLDNTKVHTISLTANNRNNQPVTATGNLEIYKLKSPERVLRKKPWAPVEWHHLPKDEFTRLFPHEVYDSTQLKARWPLGKNVFAAGFNTASAKTIDLGNIKTWQTGSYMLKATFVDAFKDTVTVEKQFEVFNASDTVLPDNRLFDYRVTNSDFKKDGYAEIKFSTAAKELVVHINAMYKGQSVFKDALTIKDENTSIKIPVKEQHKGKIDITLFWVKFNSFYQDYFTVPFPEVEKKLNIETLTFRNTLLPDKKETWSFKITGSDTKNAEAEVLASMYDASLDQFKSHDWNLNINPQTDSYYYYYGRIRIDKNDNFTTSRFYPLKKRRITIPGTFYKNYQQFNWFGFNFNNVEYVNKAYLKTLKRKPENTVKETGNISGIITDQDGIPLPGVSIVIKGTTKGTQTDFDGFYSIDAKPGDELVISYLGQKSEEALVGNSGTINVNMAEDSQALEEVVVTGLGIRREKKALGYAVSVDSLRNDIATRLGGEISGLQIMESSGTPGIGANIVLRGYASVSGDKQPLFVVDGVPVIADGTSVNGKDMILNPSDIMDISVLKGAAATSLYGSKGANGVVIITTKKGLEETMQVDTRNNLKETAFFFPHLTTNKKGEVSFSFDSPQALTRWRLMLLAHTKNLDMGSLEKLAVTQKDLMVIPNIPRFLREKDTVVLSAKITNLSKKTLSGITILQLYDAISMQPVDDRLIVNDKKNKNFSIPSKGNGNVSWRLVIPEGLQALQYKIIAKAGSFSDGEESALPVLSNRMLVTEAKPLWVKTGQSKTVTFNKLKNPISSTLKNHRLTLEYASNPAWYAIQSLPYLMEFPHECAEQTFSRYYANALGSHIINSNPKIKAVFENWTAKGQFQSNLEKNEDLKAILIAETPWLRDAQSEAEKKKRLAMLFDLEKLRDQELQTLNKLKELQSSSGAFPWFSGGHESNYITRHIVAGFGHLQHLKVDTEYVYKAKTIIEKALKYLDTQFLEDYTAARKHYKEMKKDTLEIGLNKRDIHYLYLRSFYLDTYPIPENTKKVVDFYIEKSKTQWLTQNLYSKGMMALYLYRMNDKKTAKVILTSLKENAIITEDEGMYWKSNTPGWFWYQAPVETHALMIEVFSELKESQKSIDELKLWLLKNKKTTQWKTTKATTEAVYALLLQGNDWLSVKDNTVITIGDEKIKTKKLDETQKEAGTGYLRLNWKAEEISPEMAAVTVKNKSNVTGFGGFYWQYFEDLDHITSNETSPLQIKKDIFLKQTTDSGETLSRISPLSHLKPGDLLTVRIEITSKNDMEFVHLKDLRASGVEPVDVLSSYKWQDGLGYYQSTKDVATHFFFDTISRGSYVFEYDVRVNNAGSFSNGITTIQSMYAPEFASHSKGIRITVKE